MNCNNQGPKARKPGRAELLTTAGKTLPDVIAPRLRVLFCGINPGLYSAFVGHHFARPGNRFWPALFASGFTDRLLDPSEERELLTQGCGITNIVARATAAADELTREELIAGAQTLREKAKRYRVRAVAVLGVGAYRLAFGCPEATVGPQGEGLAATAPVWVLPNPSGLNAHFTPPRLAELFREFRLWIESAPAR